MEVIVSLTRLQWARHKCQTQRHPRQTRHEQNMRRHQREDNQKHITKEKFFLNSLNRAVRHVRKRVLKYHMTRLILQLYSLYIVLSCSRSHYQEGYCHHFNTHSNNTWCLHLHLSKLDTPATIGLDLSQCDRKTMYKDDNQKAIQRDEFRCGLRKGYLSDMRITWWSCDYR